MKKLQQLIARVVKRLDTKGDMPITAADLANILEQEMRQVELDAYMEVRRKIFALDETTT